VIIGNARDGITHTAIIALTAITVAKERKKSKASNHQAVPRELVAVFQRRGGGG